MQIGWRLYVFNYLHIINKFLKPNGDKQHSKMSMIVIDEFCCDTAVTLILINLQFLTMLILQFKIPQKVIRKPVMLRYYLLTRHLIVSNHNEERRVILIV